jgi:hypothetical protein
MKQLNIVLEGNNTIKVFIDERQEKEIVKSFDKHGSNGTLFFDGMIIPKSKILFIQSEVVRQQ